MQFQVRRREMMVVQHCKADKVRHQLELEKQELTTSLTVEYTAEMVCLHSSNGSSSETPLML